MSSLQAFLLHVRCDCLGVFCCCDLRSQQPDLQPCFHMLQNHPAGWHPGQRVGCIAFHSSLFAAGGQWTCAAELLQHMQAQGCPPDVVTYTALISACGRAGEWQRALAAFGNMAHQGCRPDTIVYNAIIDTLWETGVFWAQHRVSRSVAGCSSSAAACLQRATYWDVARQGPSSSATNELYCSSIPMKWIRR